jgi:hypothetical protein
MFYFLKSKMFTPPSKILSLNNFEDIVFVITLSIPLSKYIGLKHIFHYLLFNKYYLWRQVKKFTMISLYPIYLDLKY